MMQDRAVMEQVLSLVATSESNCDAWLGDDDKFLATSWNTVSGGILNMELIQLNVKINGFKVDFD